jgi:hypothetical protein
VFTSRWFVLEKGNRCLLGEKYLSILSHVFKQPSNTTQTLVKVLTLFQRLIDSLNDQLATGSGASQKAVTHAFKTFSYSFAWAFSTFSVALT